MDNFSYDKDILLSNCTNTRNPKYLMMSKTQLLSAITIDYHRIEKGLAMQNCVPNFGVKSKVLQRLYNMFKIYLDRFNNDDKILYITYHSILDYYNWHLTNHYNLDCNFIKLFLEKNNKYEKGYSENKIGGINIVKKETTINNLKNFNTFFKSRRSVREYSKEIPNDEIIKDSINNALIGTPTICNRNLNRVHIIKNYNLRKKILSYQNGNRGFGIDAPVLLLITSDLENFQDSTERRSPYIGGGMFCMSLLYTLHANQIATCCLNWDVDFKKDKILRELLNLKNETVIMLMTVGYYKDKYKIAISSKVDVNDIIKLY